MFKKLASGIRYPAWVQYCPRYRRLDLLDKLLDGTFYDHLPAAFYDEEDHQGNKIPLESRRPSVQYHLPRMVARWTGRKLFSGRHKPRVRHKDEKSRRAIAALLRKSQFFSAMTEAAILGSVGAVAVTFRLERKADGEVRIGLNVWRAKYCEPSFDSLGELTALRLQYVTSGAWMKAIGAPNIDVSQSYWLVRDYLPDREITYLPVKKDDWNPVDGFLVPTDKFVSWQEFKHDFGFVPGHWFRNLPGGHEPDGSCTWEDAIPNSIEIDYTMSQIGRGTRYNAAPSLVVIGEVLNSTDDGGVTRSVSDMIHLRAGSKDENGNVMDGGDAKLLEMSGAGIDASLKLIDRLRNMALEQIAAARKDPEKLSGPMSGRAMEFLDEEFHDLIDDLKTSYGDYGAMPLARKILQAGQPEIDLSSFTLAWPRLFQPTPTDLAQMVAGLGAGPAQPAQPGASASGDGPAKPGRPATTGPDPRFMLITPEEARAYLAANMDLDILNDDDVDAEEPDEPEKSGENTMSNRPPDPEDLSGGGAGHPHENLVV